MIRDRRGLAKLWRMRALGMVWNLVMELLSTSRGLLGHVLEPFFKIDEPIRAVTAFRAFAYRHR